MKQKLIMCVLLACCLGLTVGKAMAAFPEKEVKFIIPYKPGGGTDAIFRVIIQSAQEFLGEPIVPINMSGAGATKGSRFVKGAKPDGYTILGHHDGIATAFYSGITDFSFDAFEPVSLVTQTPNVLVANYEFQFDTFAEILDYAKANPGKLTYTFTSGSTSYYFIVNLMQAAGGDLDWFRQVPIVGTGNQMKNLLGKHVDLAMGNIPSSFEYTKEKKLKFIAVANADRLEQIPDIPTFKELGIDFAASTSRGIFAPKGTPKEVVAALDEAIKKACETKEVKDKIAKMGSVLIYKSSAEFDEFLKKLDASYKKAIKK